MAPFIYGGVLSNYFHCGCKPNHLATPPSINFALGKSSITIHNTSFSPSVAKMSIFDQAFNTPSCFSICNEKGVSTNAVVRRILQQEDGHLWTTGCRQKKKEIDDLLSEALNGLSFEERQEQQEILHGVAARIAEEANFIEDLLHELDAHLEDIKKNSVYGIAEHMDPSYVRARKFRVMFLRATRYDARASANRMLAFFEMKHQLFGSKKLVKDITLDDLDDDDIVCLKSGWIQLAGKDMAGRQIILNLPGLRDENVPLRSDLRIRYYIKMIMLESEEAQITGTIPIVYAVGDMKDRSGGSGYSTNATTGHVGLIWCVFVPLVWNNRVLTSFMMFMFHESYILLLQSRQRPIKCKLCMYVLTKSVSTYIITSSSN